MKALFDAIYGKLAGSDLATNHIAARMYLSQAPQGASFPYVTYELVTGITDWTFCADMEFDDVTIQFNLFSNNLISAVEVTGMFTDLIALYDWCNLTVAGYTYLYMRREFYHLVRDIENGVWQYIVQYAVMLEH